LSFDLKIVNGDLVLKNGDLASIKGKDKLIQDILKIALTPAGGNVLQPWYGSLLQRTLVGSPLQTDIITSVAKTQLQNALETLKNLQNLQVSAGQKVDPSEQLAFIKDINIERNRVDPRQFRIQIVVLNRAFGTVSVSLNV
jgi:phage baseplate assembly protein W